MEQYRVYDRLTLEYIDGGIIRDYTVDMDYLTDNASTVTLTEETYAKKGDVIVGADGVSKIFMGCVTAVDNTKKQISFKHPKALFDDNVLNVFKYAGLSERKFDAVDAAKTLLTFAFISTDDPKKRLPLRIETKGKAEGAVWTDDGSTIGLMDFFHQVFDSYNVFVDIDLDFNNNEIVCRVIRNSSTGVVIKDNIKLSEPTFDKNELPASNTAVVYNGETGEILKTYYLLEDNTITEDSADPKRLTPVQTKYIEYAEDKGYTPEELAAGELIGNIYNHCIQIKLSKEQNLVKPLDFKVGDGVKIIYKEREYDSIFTGLKFNKADPYYTCIFGKTRIDFTDRLKLFIDKKYRKK